MSIEWLVPEQHPSFAGHFPGRPILPGVVLLDKALLLAGTGPWSVVQAKFLHPVLPGDCLQWTLTAQANGGLTVQAACATQAVFLAQLKREAP